MFATTYGIVSVVFLLMASFSSTNAWLGSPHYSQNKDNILVFISDYHAKSIFMANVTDAKLLTEAKYVKLPMGAGRCVTTVLYDVRHRWLYWSEGRYYYTTEVRKADIDATGATGTIVVTATVWSMDLDESCHTLYFTHRFITAPEIRKADVTDGGPNAAVTKGASYLDTRSQRGLKYDKITRRVVWTDKVKVWSRDTDSWIGEDRYTREEIVHVGEEANLLDIELDFAECRIYWFTEQGLIESVDFNGTDRRVHFNSTSQAYQIVVLRKVGDVMYFGDTVREGLGAINLTSGDEVSYVGELQKEGGGVLDIQEVYGLDIVFTDFVDYCCMVTCEGGGTCVNEETGARCICTPNLNGTRCELDADECLWDPFPCDLSHGVCNNIYGSYVCGCESGYWIRSGIECINANICDGDDACLNGGSCINDSCTCMYGFIGDNCELVDCDINPCKVGSTCSNDLCQCQPGFKGSTCESIDCNIDPCTNGAVCENHSCTCPEGYIGLTCWYKIPARTVHNVTFFDADPH